MARIKYSSEVQPLVNEHYGFTFQRNHYGQSMFPASRSTRSRYARQNQAQHFNQKAVTQWRNMSPETKADWGLFAATFQQPSHSNPALFLSGYQLFLKRNSYCFLNHGISSEFMLAPEMAAKTYEETVFVLEAGDNTVDLTELYITNFGVLPEVGQYLLFCAIPYSDKSGQFFTPIFDKLKVEAVYLDGFFLNLFLPENSTDICYSIFLSKPVSGGQSYVGAKIRYMGCFTSKKFTALTDVPAVTPADAGKVWGILPDGTWGPIPGGSGGGLTCEDLPSCPTIILQNAIIADLANNYVAQNDISTPEVHLGLVYNKWAAIHPLLPSTAGWRCPTDADFLNIQTFLGGSAVAGQKMKENNPFYWSPNTGTNTALFFSRASWDRQASGLWPSSKLYHSMWSSSDPAGSATAAYWSTYASTNVFQTYIAGSQYTRGYSVRLCRNVSGVADYTVSSYQGNNGRFYRTVILNGIEWLADNLSETLLSDGTPIPEITDNAEWSTMSSLAFCAPKNDWALV